MAANKLATDDQLDLDARVELTQGILNQLPAICGGRKVQ
jgi:hypothetical protein